MNDDLKEFLDIIKTGSPLEVKKAQKAIESYWHRIYIPNRERGRAGFEIFLDEIKQFDKIVDDNHRMYFISSLKWAFWSIGDFYFDIFAGFVLKAIQHPSGKVRRNIVSTSDILLHGLALPDGHRPLQLGETENDRKKREKVDLIKFGTLVLQVENLIKLYFEPKYKRYKYVSSLPPGIYKSLNQLLTEALLPSNYYEKVFQHFLSRNQTVNFKH